MGEITILPPASPTLAVVEGEAHPKDNQIPSSSALVAGTKPEDVPVSKGQEGRNTEGALTDNEEPLTTTSSPPESTKSTGSAQSISSTAVEPPTSPPSSTSSMELSPPATSVPTVAEPKLAVAGSNTDNKASLTSDAAGAKKADERMEDEVTKVAEKVGELDLEKRG